MSSSAGLDPRSLPIPRRPGDEAGAFRAPWEAQAFAITVQLHAAGHFSWAEWAACLSARIAAAQAAGDADLGDTYYQHWLAALEALVTERDLVDSASLLRRKQAWREAAEATPHGEPIVLAAAARAAHGDA